MKDRTKIQGYLSGLALAENMGDVNSYLPLLAAELGEPAPLWSERYSRFVWAWEDDPDPDSAENWDEDE